MEEEEEVEGKPTEQEREGEREREREGERLYNLVKWLFIILQTYFCDRVLIVYKLNSTCS